MDNETKITKSVDSKRKVISKILNYFRQDPQKGKHKKAIKYWNDELKLSDAEMFDRYSNRQPHTVVFRMAKKLINLYELELKVNPDWKTKPSRILEIYKETVVSISKPSISFKELNQKLNANMSEVLEMLMSYFRGGNNEKYSSYLSFFSSVWVSCYASQVSEERMRFRGLRLLYKAADSLEGEEREARQKKLGKIARKMMSDMK